MDFPSAVDGPWPPWEVEPTLLDAPTDHEQADGDAAAVGA